MRRDWNQTLICVLILLLGTGLRLLFIDKPDGFWHNEMVMYNQAVAGFPFGIIKAAVDADVHFPLYQMLLAIWMKIFSHNDVAIRLLSVVFGSLSIVFAFFTGKELKDEKLGNIFAFLVAINSVLIFYSQEVKFYILLSFLSAVGLFALARISKGKTKFLDYIIYIIANAAIIYTFTIGILYVLAQFFAFLLYALEKNKKIFKNFLIANSLLCLTFLPFVIYILVHLNKYEGAYWIFTNNIYTVMVLIQNYFTPVILGIYNNPEAYIFTIGVMPIVFIYIPILIAFTGMVKALKTNKDAKFILLISVLFLLFEVILCLNSGLRMLTRYTILAILPLLLLVSIGLYTLKAKWLKIVITYLLIINVFFIIFSPQSATRGYRDFGQAPLAKVIMQNKITDNDTLVIALRKTDFNKYIQFKGRKFSLLQDFVYKDYAYDTSKQNKYESFKDYVFSGDGVNAKYEEYFKETALSQMKKGDRLFFVWDENYNTYPFRDFKNYKKYPIMTLSLSKTNADTFRICMKYLKPQNAFILRHYKLFIFQK